MLICIDVSGIDDAAGRGPGAAKSLAAIEHLLRAHHAGKHVVSVPSSAKRALHDRGLSTLAYATLERIIVDRSQIEALRRDLHAHLLTGTGAAFEPTEESPGEHRILRVHLHHFEDFEHASRAVLLGEDRTDAALFDCIGRAWLARMRWRAALATSCAAAGAAPWRTRSTVPQGTADSSSRSRTATSPIPEGPRARRGTSSRRQREANPAFSVRARCRCARPRT